MTQHPMILFGKDNWLFLRGDSNRNIDQITGQYKLAPDFSKRWAELFEYRSQMAKELMFTFFYSIVPNKECVYARFLPDNVVVTEERPVKAVLEAASSRVNNRYYLDVLRDASKFDAVYAKGDTHWNHFGAMLAFNDMMTSIGLPIIEEDEFVRTDIEIDGDLSGKLGGRTWVASLKPALVRYRLIDNNNIKNVGQRRIYENDNKSLPRAVVFRDSFTSHQLDMLASRFSRVVCIWQPNLDYAIVEREAPDFVISQQVERFLVDCPDDWNGPSHLEYQARKQGN